MDRHTHRPTSGRDRTAVTRSGSVTTGPAGRQSRPRGTSLAPPPSTPSSAHRSLTGSILALATDNGPPPGPTAAPRGARRPANPAVARAPRGAGGHRRGGARRSRGGARCDHGGRSGGVRARRRSHVRGAHGGRRRGRTRRTGPRAGPRRTRPAAAVSAGTGAGRPSGGPWAPLCTRTAPPPSTRPRRCWPPTRPPTPSWRGAARSCCAAPGSAAGSPPTWCGSSAATWRATTCAWRPR